jgi:hypothetical protein
MALGRHLRELWRMKVGLVTSIILALLAALWSTHSIGVLPPKVEPRALETASATTRVLVDERSSSVLDLGVPTGDLEAMTSRALLVSNVMASAPVREYIARRADVPAEALQVSSPVTRDFPRQLAQSGTPKHVSDILASPDQYRLSLRANPTVPMIDVYAQAPTLEAARELANGAVAGMSDYLRDLGMRQNVSEQQQVHLQQLGPARGNVINAGVNVTLATLSFLLVLCSSSVAVLLIARVQRGWALEKSSEQLAPAPPAA